MKKGVCGSQTVDAAAAAAAAKRTHIYAAAKKLQANGSYGYGEPATDWRPTRRHGFD